MVESNQLEPSQIVEAALPAAQGQIIETSRYLTFKVDETIYGIALDHIKEIIEYGPLTQVPLAPDFIRGVFNLRGSVLPVIDLAVRLGKGVQPASKRSCFIFLSSKASRASSISFCWCSS